MPRYYCDYCDTHLTHDSPSVRKQHNAGYKHKANVREYYQQFEQLQTQSLIDQKIKEHLGQAGAMYQIGAVYNQHLAAGLPGIMQRPPRLPILPHPLLPIPGAPPSMMPGFRPPMLQRPGVPGYGMGPPPQMAQIPGQPPQMAQIPGQPPMQANGMMLPRPPPPSTMSAAPPTEGVILPPPPGSSTTTSSSSSSSAPPPGTNITQPPMYHLHPNGPPPPPASASTDSYAYASAPGAAH